MVSIFDSQTQKNVSKCVKDEIECPRERMYYDIEAS